MEGRYFFVDSDNNEVDIQEFDYEYTRNQFFKNYDKDNKKKYYTKVVVQRTYDNTGMPSYDVRTINLENIYFNNRRLCVYTLMVDDLYFSTIQLQNVSVPPLMQEYEEFLKGTIRKIQPKNNVVLKPQREVLNPEDERLLVIKRYTSNDALIVLDWVVNFDVCSTELSETIKFSTDEQLNLAEELKNHSAYINSIFGNLSSVLNDLFSLKAPVLKRFFGIEHKVQMKVDLNNILSTLRSTVNADINRFNGVSTSFSTLKNKLKSITENVENGISACNYVIDTSDDSYNFELRLERLLKIRSSTEISLLSLENVNKNFMNNYNKLKEVQEVLVPLLIVKLQNQATSSVDEETVKIIRNLQNA